MSTVSRVVLREQVKELILQRILTGFYPPGDRLVETRIAQELGTSQAPVREALHRAKACLPQRELVPGLRRRLPAAAAPGTPRLARARPSQGEPV